MKKIIVSLSMLLTIGVGTVAAAPVTTPDPRVERIFQKEFAGAENVKWSEQDDFISALFLLNGHRIQAWFKKEGELVGSIRGLSYSQLPLLVLRSLQSRFEEAVVIEIREVTNTEGTNYKIVLENKDKKYKVSIRPDGTIEETQKMKK
jgi:hypothetical protein